MNKGWICLHRQLLDCDIWNGDEPFDMRSAWIDLLLLCNHRDKQIIFDMKPLIVKRGQFVTSVRKLADRWNWSPNKTLRYLRLLEQLNMINKKSDNKKTVLTIIKYEVYQDNENTDGYTDEYTDEHTDESQTTIKNNETNIYISEVINLYNTICVSFPKLRSISAARTKAIKARLNTYSVDDFRVLFEKAQASDFLKGKNNKDWSASFDWLIKDANMAKVLDGNYDNKEQKDKKPVGNKFNNFNQRKYNFEELEKEAFF